MGGFLGTRGSFMLDVVFVAMFLLIPALLFSIYQVKYRRRYVLHKRLQLGIAAVVGAAVLAFEIEMRVTGWTRYAAESPYYSDPWYASAAGQVLIVHLFFSVTTTILWVVVTARALRHFKSPIRPGPHSRSHMFWGRITVVDTLLTAITGCLFYYLAFWATK
ncbi:MAG: DUF420 domain-containing protein [Planctomycetota bacterium]